MPSDRKHSNRSSSPVSGKQHERRMRTKPQNAHSLARRMAVLLLAANSVAITTTSAWTPSCSSASFGFEFGSTTGRSCAKRGNSPGRWTSSPRVGVGMSMSSGSSYEDQYKAFAKQQHLKSQEQVPVSVSVPVPVQQSELQPLPPPNQVGIENTVGPNQNANANAIPNPITNTVDPIRNGTKGPSFANPSTNVNTNANRDNNQKAQEELEMAFLEFISVGASRPQHTFPLVGTQNQQLQSPKQPQTQTRESLASSTIESFATASDSAFLSTESEPAAATFGSPTNNDPPTIAASAVEDAASKGPSFSTSTSYLDNLGSEPTSTSTSLNNGRNAGESAVESRANVPVGSESNSNSNTEDNYYMIEVRVETTFPTGITVEGAKLAWLEFCWARGGGIVIPAAVPEPKRPPSASQTNSTDAEDAPATIKFGFVDERQESTPTSDSDTNTKTNTNIDGTENTKFPPGVPSSRELIVPLGLKQELVSSTSILDEIQAGTIRRDVVTYKTTQRGFFCQDMIRDTHEGRVEFIGASYTSTRMIWTVSFQVEQDDEGPAETAAAAEATNADMPTTIRRTREPAASNVMEFASTTKTMVEGYSRQFMDSNPGLKTMLSRGNLWGSWSQFQLKTASQNLIAYLDTSVDSMPVLEHTEILPVGVSPREAMEAWYDYYWKNGGGAIPVVPSPKRGSDARWILPSGLEEELISLEYDCPALESGVDGEITTETEIAKAVYKVNNPNLLTYPVYYHRATVRFERDVEAAPTTLVWKVCVKPYRKFLSGGVLFWTKNGIALAARNLRNYLELRQLERKEIELEAKLEWLRLQNRASGSGSGSESNTAENDDLPLPPENSKTIRSTVSISSGRATYDINVNDENENDPTSIANSDNDTNDYNSSNNNTNAKKDLRQPLQQQQQQDDVKRPVALASPGVVLNQQEPASTMKPLALDKEGKSTRPTMFIPNTATMPVDSHTHGVNDG